MTGRRSGMIPGRRFVVGLVLVVASLNAGGTLASADDSAVVAAATVHHAGGAISQDSTTLGALQADPQDCPPYGRTAMAQHSAQGTGSNPLPPSASGQGTWTIAAILTCMSTPIALSDVTGVTVIDSAGSPELGPGAALTAGDLASPKSDFDDPSEYPVVSIGGPATFYYNRPWRGGSDLNGPDAVTDNSAIGLDLYEGPPLNVTIAAAPATASTGTPVTFTAAVSGDPSASFTYDWRFGDALADSAAPSPRATYTDAGTWEIELQVISSDGGQGTATLPITITSSAPETSSTPTTPASPTGSTTGGGQNPAGGAKPGSGSGAKPGTTGTMPQQTPTGAKPTSAAPQATSHRQQPKSQTTTPASSATTPSSSPSPSGSSPSPSRSSPSPSRSSPGSSPSPPTAAASPTSLRPSHRLPVRHARRHRRAAPVPSTASRIVTGLLVSDVTPVPASASPLVREIPAGASAAATRAKPPGTRSPWPEIASLLAVLALLGLGAQRERGRPIRLRLPGPLGRPRPGS